MVWQQKLSDFTLGVLLQYSEEAEGERSGSGGYISVQYPFGNWVPKLQLGRDTSSLRQRSAANHYTAGVDYLFNSQSKAYVYLTQLVLTDATDTSIVAGLQYRF